MIPELSQLLRSSIDETLEDRVGVSFSGGIDSTLIAHIAKQTCATSLFSAGTEKSEDLQYAKKLAEIMDLKLTTHVFREDEILDIYGKCYTIVPSNLLKVELLVPIYKVAELAKKNNFGVVLFGSGSEELFVGYNRYYQYFDEGKDLDMLLKDEFRTLVHREINWISKVCRKIGVEARFPLYNNKLADYVFSIPLEIRTQDKELKKGLLREAAKLLKVPDIAIQRKKRAMQYGSGIHKVLLKNSAYINRNFPVPERVE